MARIGPLRIRILEGSPITVGDTTLVPQAQLITCGQQQGWVARKGFGARGWACGMLIPRTVIEQRGDQSQRIPVADPTGEALLAMLMVGLAVALLCMLVQILAPSLQAWAQGE